MPMLVVMEKYIMPLDLLILMCTRKDDNVLYFQTGKKHIWRTGSYVVLELFKIKCLQHLLFQVPFVILRDLVYYPALPWLINPYPVNPHNYYISAETVASWFLQGWISLFGILQVLYTTDRGHQFE